MALKMATKLYTDTEICLKCVDENEILYDGGETFLQRIKTIDLDCPEDKFEEILRNIELCEEVLFMGVKQRTILNDSRVRFNARKDVAELQATISATSLSKDCKDYLRDISKVGYESLKEDQFFKHFVELDSVRQSNVDIHGKTVRMNCYPDIVALIEEIPTPPKRELKSKTDKRRSKKQTTQEKQNKIKIDDRLENSDGKSTSHRENIVNDCKDLERVVVSVKLTARNHINAVDVFRQLIFYKLLNAAHFYLLVYHVGPLVEKQHIAFYKYNIPSDIQTLLDTTINNQGDIKQEMNEDHQEFVPFTVSQTVHKTLSLSPQNTETEKCAKPSDFNVSQLESEFRRIKGKSLRQASPLKDYFRYLVYDTPGVKDHKRDAKARYERYVNKKEEKKMKKKSKKEQTAKSESQEKFHISFIENKHNEDNPESNIGDCGSSVHSCISEQTLSKSYTAHNKHSNRSSKRQLETLMENEDTQSAQSKSDDKPVISFIENKHDEDNAESRMRGDGESSVFSNISEQTLSMCHTDHTKCRNPSSKQQPSDRSSKQQPSDRSSKQQTSDRSSKQQPSDRSSKQQFSNRSVNQQLETLIENGDTQSEQSTYASSGSFHF